MYFHCMLGANDLDAATKFYDATFAVLDVPIKGQFRDDPPAFMYGEPDSGLFLLTKPIDGAEACSANGGTVMFKAADVDMVNAWYDSGLANGGNDVNGRPTEGALPGSIMGYLRDPTGNKVAVVTFV